MTPNIFKTVLSLVALTSTALCGPLGKRGDDPPYSETKGISQELFDMMQLMVQYSAAAYYPHNVNSPNDNLSCSQDHCPNLPKGNCPRVEQAVTYTAEEFQGTQDGDDNGYLAIDNSSKLIVLAFRGTSNIENWVHNFEIVQAPTTLCDNCLIHQGFLNQYTAVSPSYRDMVARAHENYTDYRLMITGHSLGGALATLAAAEIRNFKDPWFREHTELYTFGSPRVGNEELARYLTNQSPLSYRVTSMHDIVPRLPPIHAAVPTVHDAGYWHMQPEYWIRKHPDNPSPHDITVLTGYNNDHGNRDSHSLRVEPHRHYFGFIRSCGDDEY